MEEFIISIYVCDAIMGAGKTSAAITYMNEHPDKKFLYVTPYLPEVERIIDACPALKFRAPSDERSTKLESLHKLLSDGCNIASTHSLFRNYTRDTEDLIQNAGYTLIMDEVFTVIDALKFSSDDISVLLSSGLAEIGPDGEHIVWLDDNYTGTRFADVKLKAQSNNLIRYRDKMMFWTFPVHTFTVFDDVFILTYLFDAQVQRYYYDMHKVPYTCIGTSLQGGVYRFSDNGHAPEYTRTLKDKIHILDDDKINSIGASRCALSSNWYKKAAAYKKKPLLDTMRKNIYNVFKNRFGGKSDENMWTCFKTFQKYLAGGGYTKGFVSCNARATNEYADRTCLAYCVNIFLDPDIAGYFRDHHVRLEEDKYALSEMIQWIWRSAIRRGEPIAVYVPSRRMRTLLQDWLDDLSKEG